MNALQSYLLATKKKQRDFAVEAGVREATVSGWVNGITPRPAHMAKIAEVTAGAVPVTSWFEHTEKEVGAA